MSNSLILSWAPWPIGMNGEDLSRDYLTDRITAAIPMLDIDTLANAYFDLHGEDPGEWRNTAICRTCGEPISAPEGKGVWEHDDALGNVKVWSDGVTSNCTAEPDENEGEDTEYRPFDGCEKWESETRDRLIEAIGDVLGDSNGCTTMDVVGDRTYILAGGSSYGDDPCDEFRSLILLSEAGLLNSERPLNNRGCYVLTAYEDGWPGIAIGPFADRFAAGEYIVTMQEQNPCIATIGSDPRGLPIEAPTPED